MNKEDRRHIQAIHDKIEDIREQIEEARPDERATKALAWIEALSPMNSDIEEFHDAEQDKYDNMPEGLQGSERGERMYDGITNLEQAQAELESAMDALAQIGKPETDADELAETAYLALDDVLSYLQDAIS